MQLNIFYNTTNLKGKDLKDSIKKAKSQNEIILNMFRQFPNSLFTPSDVHNRLFGDNTPVTSIRRAMTTLTKENELIKTELKSMGAYGKPEYRWKYNGSLNRE